METEEVEIIHLELKYCERCGGMWLRPRGIQTVYCAACAPAMAEVSVPPNSKRPVRLPIYQESKGQGASLDIISYGSGGLA